MRKRTLALSLILIGWVLSGYIFIRTRQPGSIVVPDLCLLIFGKSCDQTYSGVLSQHAGFPLASIGLAYFGLMGLLYSLNRSFTDKMVVVLGAIGTGSSIFLCFLLYRGGFFCPLCYLIHLVNLITLLVVFIGVTSPFSGITRYDGKQKLLRWVFPVFLVIIAGGFSEYYLLKSSYDQKYKVDFNELQKTFQSQVKYEIPVNPTSPVLGDVSAPVQLIVFSSFQCPSCKSFAPQLENLYKKFGDKISITFKNFPLSNKCNQLLLGDMQPQSCNAALAAIAAREQGLFWKYHDLIFNSDLKLDEKALESFAISAGLNIERWQKDKQSDAVKKKLIEDIQIANQLRINATPTVFIDGRKVSSIQESAMVFLIEAELNKSAK